MKKRKLTILVADSLINKSICGLVFKKRGEFVLNSGEMQATICKSGNTDSHIIYAHVVDGEVVYIGESSTTFRNRMRLYLTHEGSTNVRVREHLMKELVAGKKVEIYYYKPATVVIDSTLTVNPYVSIEQAIIGKLRPILNKKDTAQCI